MKHDTKVSFIGMVMLLYVATTLVFAQVPDISVTPDSLCDSLFTGGTSSQWVTISNTGGSDLVFYVWIESYTDNYALQFNGFDSYVDCGNDPSINIEYSITLEAWFYAFDWNGNRRILQKGMDDWNEQYYILVHDDVFHFGLYGTSAYELSAPQMPSTNRWHHVAGVYNYSAGVMRLYIDGTKVDTATGVTGTIVPTSDPLFIGTKNPLYSPPGDYFNGMIDEVRIWNIARTESEIQQYMHQELTGTEPGLVAYWPFNEGSGDTIFDYSSNNNNGTLHGGMAWVSTSPPLSWLSATPTSGTVPADSSMEIEVTFDAARRFGGNYYKEIVIISNDPYEPEVIVPTYLHVTGAPDIVVSTDTLDFGVVFIGYSATDMVTVSNEGIDVLTVSDIFSDNTDYTVDTTTFSLAPGANQEVSVTFTPSTPGVSLGHLTITSNDPDEPTVTIALLGAGMTGIAEGDIGIPKLFSISESYPNPFNQQTVTHYACPYPSKISLKIFDLTGRLVKILLDEEINAGYHSVRWNGMNNTGSKLPTGVYFLKFSAGDYTETRKLLLIR